MKKVIPTDEEVREHMELHNNDECGQGANKWNFEESRYHLELSDKWIDINKELERTKK